MNLTQSSLWRRIRQTSPTTKKDLAAAAFILALTVTFFWPVLRGQSFSMVAAHMFDQYPWKDIIKDTPEVRGRGFAMADHAETFYPATVFSTNALRSGQFPMWLPYSFGGIPIMEVGLGLGLLYPPRIFAAYVFSPLRQHDFLLFTNLLLAGLGMYALLRCWGANVAGALLAAVAWELSGHNAYWLVFEHVGIAAAWFPFAMLGATLAVRRQSVGWALVSGAAFGLLVLAGYLMFAQLSALALIGWYGALTLSTVIKGARQRQWRSVFYCLSLPVVSALVAASFSAAGWLPVLGLLSHSYRQVETLGHQTFWALSPRSLLLGLIVPERSLWVACQAFVGIPTLVLAVPALFRRSAPVVFASLMTLLSVGIVLGLRPLIVPLRLVVPYFAAMHLPTGIFLFCFAIAALAGLGMSEVAKFLSRSKFQRHWLLKIGFPLILIAVVSVTSIRLIEFAWFVNPTQPNRPEWLDPETPLIDSLRANQGEFHILPIYSRWSAEIPPPMVLAGKVAANFELRSGSGYESLLPITTALLWDTVARAGSPAKPSDLPPVYRPYFSNEPVAMKLLENVSVGLLAAPPNTKPVAKGNADPFATGDLRLLYSGPDGEVYKITRAKPRAFLAPRVMTAPDDATALRMLADEYFDARSAAIVIGDSRTAETGLPRADSGSERLEGSAVIVSDRLNKVAVDVDTPRNAMLVLNDSWDSGWKARVDNGAAPVYRVNFAFRGVVVPAGKHRVTFLYRPTLLLVGIAISLCTCMILIAFAGRRSFQAIGRFRRRAHAS